MDAIKEKTTKAEQKLAQASITAIEVSSRIVKRSKHAYIRIKVQEHGGYVNIPKKAFQLLVYIMKTMAEGKSISLMPLDSEISTEQAAQILNVSRPHVVKLLESGTIPFTKAGTHRRIALNDVLAYKEKQKEITEQNLAFLTQQAQELNFGY
jgi:excisionase family DNA binding protein